MMPEQSPFKPPAQARLFKSFFHGGFECSTQRRADGRRLDLLSATGHARWPASDYQQLAGQGLLTVRDGVRWHLIERCPGYYDWSSFLPLLLAARESQTQVIWDLCHYGWPDDIEIWQPQFVERFAAFAGAVAKLVKNETDSIPYYAPLNEASFWAWAGGEVGYFNPLASGRGDELKQQLVRATIMASEEIRQLEPRARLVQPEPLINIVATTSEQQEEAGKQTQAQYQVWDMLSGRLCPELGGHSGLLDIVGVNYYPYNQWQLAGQRLGRTEAGYRPFCSMLQEVAARYQRPVFIAETAAEGADRPDWLSYICDEVIQAIRGGVAIEGICLYPILDFPGWDDDRHCDSGLFSYIDPTLGSRPLHQPLAAELADQQQRFSQFFQHQQLLADPALTTKLAGLTRSRLTS